MKRLVNIVPFLLLLSLNINGQITVDPGNTAPFDFENIIENVFLGNGVEIVDVKYFGDPKAVGVFANAENVIGLNRGIIMTTGHATDAVRNSGEFANEDTTQDQLDDEDLESLLVNNIDLIDIAKYEISFIPTSDTLRFRYVFASEEYPDFVCTSTNDVFGFFINGPDPDGGSYDFKNIALVPDPSDPSMNTFLDFPVSVNFVNGGMPGNSVPVSPYCEEPLGSLDFSLYYNESNPGMGPVYNGYLDIFIAEAAVIPCELYTIKIAIADGRLGDFDSAVFLEEKSFSTGSLIINLNNPGIDGGISEGCEPGKIEISLPEIMAVDFPVSYRLLTDSSFPDQAIEGTDFEMLDRNIVIPAGDLSYTLEVQALNDFNSEDTEYVYIEINKDICNKDTIRIPITDNSLSLVSLQDSLFTCANIAQDLLIQLDSSIVLTKEQSFENNKLFTSSPQDSVIISEIIVSDLKNEFLTENMIAEICIELLIHQRLEDLDIYLQAPNGNLLELSTDNGWRPDNDQQTDRFVQTCFSLSASQNINLGNPLEGMMDLSNQTYTGSYLPEGSIDNWFFPSQSSANGIYKLIVIDDQNDNFFSRLEGWNITFNANYEIEYEWFPDTGLSCTDCDSVRIRPQQSQYYYLHISDSYLCDIIDSVWVEAYPLPDEPEILCDSVDVSEIHLSWEQVPNASEYEILINGKYPWIRINNDTTFLRNELRITTSQNNTVDLHGFLPEEEATILIRSVSEFGCLSTIDTILCRTLPCMDGAPRLDSIIIDQPICDTDGSARVDIYADDKDSPLTYRLIYPFSSFENNTGIFFAVQQGSWPVRIIDTVGCITEDTIRVFDPLPLEIIADITPISCRGADDGAIEININ
ncbi:MAG: choice-of-anchor L domain-containing protein, partial [Bacteroidia bacterium]|nr:choice-of-anchor L domain-containing protein [Bacteroidia bacterium]